MIVLLVELKMFQLRINKSRGGKITIFKNIILSSFKFQNSNKKYIKIFFTILNIHPLAVYLIFPRDLKITSILCIMTIPCMNHKSCAWQSFSVVSPIILHMKCSEWMKKCAAKNCRKHCNFIYLSRFTWVWEWKLTIHTE